jgi:mono/diheme cytochrome c family protein
MRMVKAHAAGIALPAALDDPAKLVIGTEHFAVHCAICHGGPGVPPGDIAHGLYPPPPDLARAASRYTPGELFWIIKNGIKSTGMPSWSDHSDEEIWATVAFLEKLPGLDEPAYAKLVMQSIAAGGHHHHGDDAALH